jgi:hypothetical protein
MKKGASAKIARRLRCRNIYSVIKITGTTPPPVPKARKNALPYPAKANPTGEV